VGVFWISENVHVAPNATQCGPAVFCTCYCLILFYCLKGTMSGWYYATDSTLQRFSIITLLNANRNVKLKEWISKYSIWLQSADYTHACFILLVWWKLQVSSCVYVKYIIISLLLISYISHGSGCLSRSCQKYCVYIDKTDECRNNASASF